MRELAWDGYRNCRDLGGLPTAAGPTAWGRVARGPRREQLTAEGWAAAKVWGLRTVIDLRCPDEIGHRQGDPLIGPEDTNQITIVNAPTEDHGNEEFVRVCFPILDSPECWPHNLRILADLVCTTMTALAHAEPGVLVHCSAGRDRTGMITALLLGNAGVEPVAVADDYAESVRAMAGAAAHQPTPDRQSTWGPEQTERWVAHTAPLVAAFAADAPRLLTTIGVSDADQHALRRLLLHQASG